MRRDIAIQHLQVCQLYRDVPLPLEPDYYTNNSQQRFMLANVWRRSKLFNDPLVNKALKIFQRPLIAIFMHIANKNTQQFDFDSCSLIFDSLLIKNYHPKKSTTRQPL